jgi:ankyrin repeat protein
MNPAAEQLMMACEAGDIEAVRRHVGSGVDPSTTWDFPSRAYKHGESALMWATRFDHLEIVRYLIDCGANRHYSKKFFGNVMHRAAFHNRPAIGQFLLTCGHDIESRTDPCLRTPLHVACGQLSFDFVALLIANGADPNAKDYVGCTPLDLASLYADRRVFEFLEQYGGVHGRLNSSRT